MPESLDRRSTWLDRWVFRLWTPLVVVAVLAPLYWVASAGNFTAGWLVTIAVEGIGALLIVTIGIKVYRDRKRPTER